MAATAEIHPSNQNSVESETKMILINKLGKNLKNLFLLPIFMIFCSNSKN